MKCSLMRTLILTVFAWGMAGTVHATTLSSGPIYGGHSQTRVVCSVINMGNAPFTFANKVIYSTFNGAVGPSFDDCVGSLLPGGICTYQAAADGNQAYACKIITNGTGTVRATMRANDRLDHVLIEEDLR